LQTKLKQGLIYALEAVNITASGSQNKPHKINEFGKKHKKVEKY